MENYNNFKKTLLWLKIRAVATFYKEDSTFTRVYAKEVYEAYKEDLDTAIKCFTDLEEGIKKLPPFKKVKEVEKYEDYSAVVSALYK